MGRKIVVGGSRRRYAEVATVSAALACVGATAAGVPGRWDVVVQDVIAAPRSNRLGTAWGEPVRVGAPGRWPAGALNISAQRDKLDVLGLMGSGATDSVQHTQLLPGVTLKLTRKVRRPDGGVAASFRVGDAGDPVGGARVSAAGAAAVAGGNGVATLVLGARGPAAVRATASRAGYVADTIRFRGC